MFLGIFTTLTSTFLICFVIISIFLPRMYERIFIDRFGELILELSQEIENAPREELVDLITAFAFENHADVLLEIGDEEISAASGAWKEDETTEPLWFGTTSTNGITGEVQSLSV